MLADIGRHQPNPILNKQLSLSVVGTVKSALRQAGYGMLLYVTPSTDLPDHHTLAVFDWADALINAFVTVVPNSYPKPRP